jgi:hypothetical protein
MNNEKKVIEKYLKLLNFEKGTHGFLMLSYLVKEYNLSLITSIEEELPCQKKDLIFRTQRFSSNQSFGYNHCLEEIKSILSNYKQ